MSDFTRLLTAASKGDREAAEMFFNLVYNDLRQLAAQCLAQEKPGHTLQPTALVHEVYLRLVGVRSQGNGKFELPHESRGLFFISAATAMRRILIESARRKNRKKNGGLRKRVSLDPDVIAEPRVLEDLLALDEALTRLEEFDPRSAQLVSLRYFGGLTMKEAASILGISSRTADSDWAYARAWLLAELRRMDNCSE